MADVAVQIAELAGLVRELPTDKRTPTLGRLLDFFVQESGRYRAEHVAVFDSVMNEFIAASEAKVLAALSQRLAPLANAPTQVVKYLACHDDIAIAEPVLMQSPSIADSVINEIVQNKGQSHLLAIACRPQLSPAVTDALIASGDDVVVRYAFNNPGAAFSESGVKTLLERGKSDGALAELIKQRKDFPKAAA